jgi:hypothetical protein
MEEYQKQLLEIPILILYRLAIKTMARHGRDQNHNPIELFDNYLYNQSAIVMWTCPRCERQFKTANQMHTCSDRTIDDIFEGKPQPLLYAFDALLVGVIDWEPISVGAAKRAIVFTKYKAWLIVRPMSKELDIKFYYPEVIQHPLVRKTVPYRKDFAHHIRISDPDEVNEPLLQLLRRAYEAQKQ